MIQVKVDIIEENKQIESLNAEIDKGLASLESGQYFTSEAVYNELIALRKSYTT